MGAEEGEAAEQGEHHRQTEPVSGEDRQRLEPVLDVGPSTRHIGCFCLSGMVHSSPRRFRGLTNGFLVTKKPVKAGFNLKIGTINSGEEICSE